MAEFIRIWLQFGWIDAVDILVIACILFGCYKLIRQSGALNLFWGILCFVAVSFIAEGLSLGLTSKLFSQFLSVGAIVLIVLFQEELRGFMFKLGSRMNISGLRLRLANREQKIEDKYVTELVLACSNMAKSQTGALIVLEKNVPLKEYAVTGEPLDAQVSARLIENLFFKNTPLHDGALIISNGRLNAAACILPVSKNAAIPLHYGLRHRAALGLSEKTDALAIVVSEETGKISVAEDGAIREVSANALTQIIAELNKEN